MSLSLIFLLLILILFIVGFIYIEPIISKHKIKSNNEYGSARFATEAEINKNFTKEKISIKRSKRLLIRKTNIFLFFTLSPDIQVLLLSK